MVKLMEKMNKGEDAVEICDEPKSPKNTCAKTVEKKEHSDQAETLKKTKVVVKIV
jgi:hypothetical protein